MNARTFTYFWIMLLGALSARGQDDAMVKSISERFGLYAGRAIQEKMYVHIDRPLYLVGETMWFKANILNGATHHLLDLSRVAYLEVLDADNNPLVQTKFAMLDGKGNGSLQIPSSISSGRYRVRCYTNWMKNFSAENYFESAVTFINPFVRFDPGKPLVAGGQYDAQFFPEGGNLVKGLESRVAFRAVSANGKGITFRGALLDSQNDTVSRFQPEKNGIGHFTFTPRETSYRAVVIDEAGNKSEHKFPEVQPEGYVMQVKDSTDRLIKVLVQAQLSSDEPVHVYMLSHTRQNNAVVEKKAITRGRTIFVIDKTKLGEGVSHITVFNDKVKPVAERLYFKRPSQQLQIDAKLSPSFVVREKVAVDLTTTLAGAGAGMSNLSVAIYLNDSIQAPMHQDINSYLWLTADLKGNIETPDYYFNTVSKETDRQLDNLMMTHGWRRFKWDQILGRQAIAFENLPEHDGHFIVGKLVDKVTGNPARNKEAYLAPLDFPARLFVAQSDDKGKVVFEVRRFTGLKEVTLQTNLGMDSSSRFEMVNPFSKQFSSTPPPVFSFDKTLENQLLARSINMQAVNAYLPRLYKEKKPVLVDSLAFFGTPDEKYFLDDFTRFPTMEEVLREYVRGVIVRRRQKEFHFRIVDKLLPNTFYNTDPLILVDGIPVFDADKVVAMDPLKVKKVEVMNSRYFLGPMTFTGIVSLSTYGNDLASLELDPNVLVMSYEGVQDQREFYAPRYDNANAASRIPDLRNLLHWSPDVLTDPNGRATLEFYTSDQTGQYQVVIQGLTKNGVPGSKVLNFSVGKRNF